MKYLNQFVLIGIALIAVSIVGLATSNKFLTEPGQPVNPYATLEYFGAAVIMLVNGAISIGMAKKQGVFQAADTNKTNAAEKSSR